MCENVLIFFAFSEKGGRRFFYEGKVLQTHSPLLSHTKYQISQSVGVLYRQEQKTKKS